MSDVQLSIKSPSYNEDFRLQLSLAATVKQLKERIAQEHPSRPPVERQRLIFAGRLLQDTDVLKDILRLHDLSTPQTFHLVLKTEFTSGTNNAAPATPPQQPVYNQPFNQAANPYLYQQQMQMHLGQAPGHFMMPGYAPQPGHNPYYNQYPPPGPYPGQYGPAYQQRVVLQGQMNPFQQMMMAQQQQQRRQVRVININVSLVFKLLLMVYVLSQGGTTQRTLFLAIGALAIYLYQTGLLPMRAVNIVPGVPQPPNNNANNNNAPNNNDGPNNNNPAPNNNAAPNAANNNAPNNNGPNNDNNNPAPNNNAPNPNLPVPYRQPPGLWGEIHGFFVPFFYSLFPSWNPDDIHGVLQQHMQDQDEGENPAAQLNR